VISYSQLIMDDMIGQSRTQDGADAVLAFHSRQGLRVTTDPRKVSSYYRGACANQTI